MWLSTNLGHLYFKNCHKVFLSSVIKSTLIPVTVGGSSKTQIFYKSSDTKSLGHTTILWQDGSDMQELPVIVRKIQGKEVMLLYEDKHDCGLKDKLFEESSNNDKLFMSSENDLKDDIYSKISACLSVSEVFKQFESIPVEEVKPTVACATLKKIVNLENNKTFRNRSMRLTNNKPKDNFTRTALFNQLVGVITEKGDNATLLETLRILDRDVLKKADEKYVTTLSDELLIRSADGKFTLTQVCEVVKVLSSFPDGKSVDKLWVCITEDAKCINEENIMDVFRTLLYFKDSRNVILNILEKKLPQLWSCLSGSNVAEILNIFVVTSLNPGKILSSIIKWIHVNLESISVEDNIEIFNNLQALDFNHKTITTALEKAVSTRSDFMSNELFVTNLANYCLYFRIQSPILLQCCADFLISHGENLSPSSLKAIFLPFGTLNYHPKNHVKFWKVVESAFNDKFVQYCPEDILEILLNCIILEKYPVNFAQKVFNPFFLDRLHSTSDIELIKKMRKHLKILDSVMSLECKYYEGPLLPNDHSNRKVWIDLRVKKSLNQIQSILSSTLNSFQQLSFSIFLPNFPDLFTVDALIHNKSKDVSVINLKFCKNSSNAILIHLPEHYCFQSNSLIGTQVMRKRILKKLGLKVVSLDYNRLAVLHLYPKKLVDYVLTCLKNPEVSF